jgi:hypothetical protein
MKRALSIAGGISLVLLLTLVGFIGYAFYQGRNLDASSKEYVEANVPPIISTWSKDELLKRSAPQLLKRISENPKILDQMFQQCSKLGSLRSFGNLKGGSLVKYDAEEGKTTTATYTATGNFQNGEAHFDIVLILLSGQWQLVTFRIMPIFASWAAIAFRSAVMRLLKEQTSLWLTIARGAASVADRLRPSFLWRLAIVNPIPAQHHEGPLFPPPIMAQECLQAGPQVILALGIRRDRARLSQPTETAGGNAAGFGEFS